MQYPGSPYAGQKAHIGMHVVQAFARFEAEIRADEQRGRTEATRALTAEVEALVTALRRARRIIDDIDGYMKRPGRGDWGEECACCMGELLDDDRATLITIDATLTKYPEALQHKEPKP
ncbi:hypothetical protein ACGGKE_03675 [Sphingobium naphthae]